jgi:aminomethyltransferase
MVDRGIARDCYPVLNLEGREVGQITSGSPSPFLKTNIAFALVPTSVSRSGEDVLVQIRPNQTARAKQVSTPFYKRPKP